MKAIVFLFLSASFQTLMGMGLLDLSKQYAFTEAQAYRDKPYTEMEKKGLRFWTSQNYKDAGLKQLIIQKHNLAKLYHESTNTKIVIIDDLKSNQVIINFAGTEFFTGRVFSTMKIFSGSYFRNLFSSSARVSKMDQQAIYIVKKIEKVSKGKELILVGHSLSGRSVQFASLLLGHSAYIFASVGLLQGHIEELKLQLNTARDKIQAKACELIQHIESEQDWLLKFLFFVPYSNGLILGKRHILKQAGHRFSSIKRQMLTATSATFFSIPSCSHE